MYKKAEVPQVFIELKQKGQDAQKLKIKLFEDINPQTAENFQKLCEGFTNSEGKNLSYKNKKFVNNYPGFFLELEEIPETIFGKSMHNESYDIKFNQPGLIGMSRTKKKGDEKSSSGFFIALSEIDFLDQYVAVGKIVEGFEGLKNLDYNEEIKIVNCGYDKQVPLNNQQIILKHNFQLDMFKVNYLINFFHQKIILKISFRNLKTRCVYVPTTSKRKCYTLAINILIIIQTSQRHINFFKFSIRKNHAQSILKFFQTQTSKLVAQI